MLKNGKCVTPAPKPCKIGFVRKNGKCQRVVRPCGRGQVRKNGKCVTPAPKPCKIGFVRKNGKCVKPSEFSRYRDRCNGKNGRSTSSKSIRICIVVNMLQRKLSNQEMTLEDADNDLQQYLSDLDV